MLFISIATFGGAFNNIIIIVRKWLLNYTLTEDLPTSEAQSASCAVYVHRELPHFLRLWLDCDLRSKRISCLPTPIDGNSIYSRKESNHSMCTSTESGIHVSDRGGGARGKYLITTAASFICRLPSPLWLPESMPAGWLTDSGYLPKQTGECDQPRIN